MKRLFTILMCMALLLGVALSARVQIETEARARANEPRLLCRHMDHGRQNQAGAHGRGQQIHRNKPRPVDGRRILVGDPLRVYWRHGQRCGKRPTWAYDSNDKMYTYDSSTPWVKPTTPKAMWTETLGPGRARQG
jgi:hypothetical protein